MPTDYERWLMRNQWLAQEQARRDAERQQAYDDALSLEYQRKMDEANQKNETRYLDILEGRYGTRDRVLDDLATYGQNEIANANQRYKDAISRAEAGVYSRGLGGSPGILSGARLPVEAQRGRELADINNNILNRRVNADIGLSDSIYDFMERRNDVPPDLNQLIALQQGLGRGGRGYAPNLLTSAYPGASSSSSSPLLRDGTNLPSPTRPIPLPTGERPFHGQRNQPSIADRYAQADVQRRVPNGLTWAQQNSPEYMRQFDLAQTPLVPRTPRPRAVTPYFAPPRDAAPGRAMPTGPQFANFANPGSTQSANAMRGAQLAVKNALNAQAGIDWSGVEEAQNAAIAQGLATATPGQRVPTVPNMVGGPVGAGYMLPGMSLRRGMGYTPRGDYTGMNDYGRGFLNYQAWRRRRSPSRRVTNQPILSAPDYGVSLPAYV